MDIATLAVEVDSRSVRTAESDLNRMTGAGAKAEKSLTGVGAGGRSAASGAQAAASGIRSATQQMQSQERAARALTSAIRAYATIAVSAFSVAAMARYADAWSDMQSVVGAAVKNMEAAPMLMRRMVDIANASYSPLQQTVDVYSRNVTVLRELGRTSAEAADFTESLNNMLVITATRGQRAASVQDALSKAMAVGKLQADGLETVLANGGRIAEALAQQLGTTVNGLRDMASQGKITADVIANALIDSLQQVRKEAAEMPATIQDAFVRVGNNVTELIGRLDKATGVSSSISEKIIEFADGIRSASDHVVRFAELVTPSFNAVVSAISSVAKHADIAAVALAGFYAPALIGGIATLTKLLAVGLVGAIRAVTAAMMANPIGVIFAAASTAVYVFRDDIQKILGGDVLSIIAGVGGAFRAVIDNIGIVFRNSLNAMREQASEWAFGIASNLNKLFGTNIEAPLWVGPEPEKVRDVADAFREARDAYAASAKAAADAAKAEEEVAKRLTTGTKAAKEAAKAQQAFERTRRQYLNGLYGEISALQDQARGLEDQIALYGLAESAKYDLAIADLEAQKAALAVIDAGAEEIAILERKIELLGQMRGSQQTLERLGAEKAAWESWARDVEQIFNQVGQSLTDALFEGGRSARDLIKDLFKTLTLRVVIQPMLSGLQGMVTNQLGGLLGYQDPRQQGGFGGMSNALSTYNNLNTLAGGVSQWMTGASVGASNLSLGYANMVGTFGGDSIGALISANGGWEQALSGLSSATSAAVTAGALSAAPTVAASLSTSFGTAATTMASTSFTASLGGGAAAASGGAAAAGGAGGLMSGIAAAGPWIAGGLAVASLLGGGLFDREPTTRREQRTQVEYADGLLDITKRDDRVQAGADQAVAQMTAAAIDSANSLFQQIGVDATIDSFHAIMASSYAGDRDGVASGGALRIGDELRKFGIAVDDENPTIQGFGGWSSADTLPRLATDIQLSVLEAFQSVSDELPNVLAGMLEGIDVRSLGEQEAQALAERFTLLTQGASQFLAAIDAMPFAELRDLSFDAAAGMVQFAGGIDNLLTAQQTYYERFYSDAERHAHSVGQLTDALAGVGVEMPALVGSTDDMLASYRALVESLDLNTEAGQQAYVTLMQTAGAFADVAQFAGQAKSEVDGMASSLQSILVGSVEHAYSEVVRLGQQQIAKLQESFGGTDTAMNAYRSAVQRLESEFNSLFSAIDRGVQALRGTGAAFDAQYNRARAVISTTLLTGQLPQTADLTEAISTAQRGVTAQRYSSLFEQQKAYLTLANELEALQDIAKPELDAAQATLEQLENQYRLLRGMSEVGEGSLLALEEQLRTSLLAEEAARTQISLIEQQLETAKGQYEAALGLNTLLGDLPTALQSLADALANLKLGGGAKINPQTYAAANPDLAKYYMENEGHRSGLTLDQWLQKHYEDYGQYENRPGTPRSFAVGTNYVPYDMTANIHKGERIIPAADNRALIQALQGGGAADRETVQVLREQLTETRQQNRYLYELVKSGKRTALNTEDTANAVGAHSPSEGAVVVY